MDLLALAWVAVGGVVLAIGEVRARERFAGAVAEGGE